MSLFLNIPLRAVVIDEIHQPLHRGFRSGDEMLVAPHLVRQLGFKPWKQGVLNEITGAHGREYTHQRKIINQKGKTHD